MAVSTGLEKEPFRSRALNPSPVADQHAGGAIAFEHLDSATRGLLRSIPRVSGERRQRISSAEHCPVLLNGVSLGNAELNQPFKAQFGEPEVEVAVAKRHGHALRVGITPYGDERGPKCGSERSVACL